MMTPSKEEMKTLTEETMRMTGLSAEELKRLQQERIWGDDGSLGTVSKPGDPLPEVGYVEPAEYPWQDELSAQLGARQ